MSKENDKYVFYDNYDTPDYDEYKNILIDEGNENPSDDEIWNAMNDDDDEENWTEMLSEIKNILPENVLMIGYCGTWRGRFKGGKIFENTTISEIIKDIGKDCDYFRIAINEDNNLYIKCSHHDGTHIVELKGLNKRAMKYFDDWNYYYKHNELTEEQLHEKFWNSNYWSKKIELKNVA